MRIAALCVAALLLGACRQDMHDQPKYKSLRQSAFFADGRTSRPLIEGTVARGDVPDATGKVNGVYVANPLPANEATFRRGRERYDIYCSPCHDRVGTGNGMIVQRGYRQPPTFHQDRLRSVADGYFFETITAGFGVMPSYAAQVPPDDRWAIAAWIRVLQRSQHASLADVPADQRGALDAAAPEAHP